LLSVSPVLLFSALHRFFQITAEDPDRFQGKESPYPPPHGSRRTDHSLSAFPWHLQKPLHREGLLCPLPGFSLHLWWSPHPAPEISRLSPHFLHFPHHNL